MGKGGDGRFRELSQQTVAYQLGHSSEGTPIVQAKWRPVPEKGPILVGVRGSWYDVSMYVPSHPGGDIILEFAGRDATAQFVAYHPDKVLRHWKPVGTYKWDRAAPGGDPFEAAWLSLSEKFERDGLYTTSTSWIASRFALVAAFLVAAIAGSRAYAYGGLCPASAAACFGIGAVGLAGLWQQSGFLMHDFMHNHVFHDRLLDNRLGWFFGCCGFGVCSKWWRDEHHEHHLFTNTVIPSIGCTDPQFDPPEFWAHNALLFDVHKLPPWALRYVLRIQHLLFLPVAIGLGPIGIKIDALIGESRPTEHAGVLLHFLFVGWLLSAFQTWCEAAAFYATSSLCVGVLSLQLLISHMTQPVSHKDEAKAEGNWARRQVEAVIDILSPRWLDWFHGGLNLHSVHHLFPRMCREHYRVAHPQLVALCRAHGVHLEMMGWSECVANSVHNFRRVGQDALAAGFGAPPTAE